MSGKSFADLKEALEDALAFECGERRELTVTRISYITPKARRRHHRLLTGVPDPKRPIDEQDESKTWRFASTDHRD
jgi:hypothetical protein